MPAHVSDSVDMRDVSYEAVVNRLYPSAVKLYADFIEVHSVRICLAPHPQKHDINFYLFDVGALLDVADPGFTFTFTLFEARASLDFDSLPTKGFRKFRPQIAVHQRNQGRQHLHYRNVASHAVEHVGELDAHCAAPQDEHAFGNERRVDRLVRGPNVLLLAALEPGDIQPDYGRAHREDDVLGGQSLNYLAVFLGFDCVRILEACEPIDVANAVLLKKHPNATPLGEYDLVFPSDYRVEIQS